MKIKLSKSYLLVQKQIFLITMKMLFFLFCTTVFGIGPMTTFSQDSIAIKADKEVTVDEVFVIIQKQSKYRFLYLQDLFANHSKVKLEKGEISISDLLKRCFSSNDMKFELLEGNTIRIIKKDKTENNNNSTTKQNLEISGVVQDKNKVPVPGVNIIEKGKNNGAVTDFDGNFTITVSSEQVVLVISYIGYKTVELPVKGQDFLKIQLVEDVANLDEVVVVGYGEVKKSDLTGSVSQVKGKELNAFPVLSMTQAMQGRSSGVMIQAVNGAPGSEVNVRVRGFGSIGSSSNPLYVVDGFPGGALPPVDVIESIEILKDASATAIYGSRGANGVIMVTTRRGKIGKPRIDFKTSLSLDNVIKRIDLLNKDQFVDYISETNPNFINDNTIGAGTDWQDEIFRVGLKKDHNLSISGGNDAIKYYVSAGIFDQKGVITNSRFNRYSLTSNLDIKVSEKLNFGVNLFFQRTNNDGVLTQEGTGGAENTGVISAALTFEPTASIYDDKGNYTRSSVGDPTDNPVAVAKERLTETVADRFQANGYGEYEIIPDLKFRGTLGANIRDQRWGYYVPTTLRLGEDVNGDAGMGTIRTSHLINENYLTYSKVLGDNDISAMAGYSYESNRTEIFSAYSQGFLTDTWLWWNLDGASTFNQPNSSLTESELQSYYGRINYKLLNRYLITLNGRYDGSSVLAKGHKWTFFPSGAFAWNIKNEPFMENANNWSQLKFRLSYGTAGNQSIAPYQSLATFQTVHSVQNSVIVNAVRPISVANDNLSWEKITQTDVGIDLGLYNQRITVTADYFKKKTKDLLFQVQLPEYSGYSTTWKNIGSVENNGVEFALSTVNMEGSFRWVTDFNISTYKNKVLELPGGNDIHPANVSPGHMVGLSDVNLIRVGEPVGVFYGYEYNGVIQEGEAILPGNFDQYSGGEKYKDINGDGVVNGDDRTIIGNPHPDFTWGLNNTFSYKGLDLNIFMQGSQGNDIYSFTLQELETMRGTSNSTTEALSRWTAQNTNTDVPLASSARGYHSSSRWVYDGSYVRLKTISLGYNLPLDIGKQFGAEKVRVSMSAQNLFTLTNYRGFDPEVNYMGANSSQRLGFDYGSYPNNKSLTLGLNVTF